MVLRACAVWLAVSAPGWCDSAAGIQWTPPSSWKAQPPAPMRAATYAAPAAAGDKEAGECGVFFFGTGQGGGVEANVERWLGQFEDGPATPAKPKQQTIGGFRVTTIEHSGTYLAGAPMAQTKTRKPGYRLVGAIVEAPQGNVFFKFTGPAKTVEAGRAAFDKMLQSIRR
jgi:hypothetical protein